jgi:transcriptional regulator with XRE-family HTH domain
MKAKDAIRALRKEAEMTRQELAEASGLSFHTIRAYEKGRRTPRVVSLLKILKALGVSPDVRGDICALLLAKTQIAASDPVSIG